MLCSTLVCCATCHAGAHCCATPIRCPLLDSHAIKCTWMARCLLKGMSRNPCSRSIPFTPSHYIQVPTSGTTHHRVYLDGELASDLKGTTSHNVPLGPIKLERPGRKVGEKKEKTASAETAAGIHGWVTESVTSQVLH